MKIRRRDDPVQEIDGLDRLKEAHEGAALEECGWVKIRLRIEGMAEAAGVHSKAFARAGSNEAHERAAEWVEDAATHGPIEILSVVVDELPF
jgi:hypothetical protein